MTEQFFTKMQELVEHLANCCASLKREGSLEGIKQELPSLQTLIYQANSAAIGNRKSQSVTWEYGRLVMASILRKLATYLNECEETTT